jgi:hypothetical protein
MALTFNLADDREITLEEYVQHVREHVDTSDEESIAASAPWLRRLLNNRTLVADKLNAELRAWRDFQRDNSYTAQTLILWQHELFFVRANIWAPRSANVVLAEKESDLYFYGVAHDHNFTFMTGGYLGGGYETAIYEYDGWKYRGEKHVDLQFLEHTRLPRGKIMMYRESRDIHEQGYPEDYSVSINLMTGRKGGSRPHLPQLLFDVGSETVTESMDSGAGRVMMTEVAKFAGDARTAALLCDICETHADRDLRGHALDALAVLEPSREAEIAAWRERITHDATDRALS